MKRQLPVETLAPAVFVMLWSTGFLGAKFGLPYAEPATFLSVRFFIVVAILAVMVMMLRLPLPTGRQWWHLSVSGCLVHGFYLGGVFSAIHLGVNAGVSAMIVGIQPLFTAVLVGPWLGERVTPRQWLGFILGLLGVFLVILENFSLAQQDMLALALCFIGLVGISVGTVYQKRYCENMDLISGSMVQFLAAGTLLGIFAFGLETREIHWTAEFIFAMGWLVLVLSIGAISLLMWLIQRGAASRVASLFYLVPPLVALESWWLFGETLHHLAVIGMICCAVGVWLVLQAPKKS